MWKFNQPVDMIFGEGEIQNIAGHMERHGLKKALILADPFPAIMEIAQRVQDLLGPDVVCITNDVEPNPTAQNVDNCAALAQEHNAECIMAIGGGSTIDCAKMAAAVAVVGCKATDMMDGEPITGALPLVAIPTTAGTGSEVTAVVIVSDGVSTRKVSLVNPVFYPKLAVVDPELTFTCPKSLTASSGIDVLMHAYDAISSVRASPASDALALQAAKIVLTTLEGLVEDGSNKAARMKMSEASLLAGMAFSQTGTTGSHSVSYFMTAKYHIPHGESCAFTADRWIIVNAAARQKIGVIAKELGYESVEELADDLERLKKAIGMRMTLAEAGIPEEDIPEIAKQASLASNVPNNIVPITPQLVEEILRTKL